MGRLRLSDIDSVQVWFFGFVMDEALTTLDKIPVEAQSFLAPDGDIVRLRNILTELKIKAEDLQSPIARREGT